MNTDESIFDGLLNKNGKVRVFANMKQAKMAADRTNGKAFQSRLSNRFLVRFYNLDCEKN
jgi:hypothetical protein